MLHIAIAAGLVLGLIVGLGASATGSTWLLALAEGSAPFGTLFINAIRMVVIPLIVTVIFASIARLGDPRKLGRIGGLTMAYYWITLVPAIAIGMGTMALGFLADFASNNVLGCRKPRPPRFRRCRALSISWLGSFRQILLRRRVVEQFSR